MPLVSVATLVPMLAIIVGCGSDARGDPFPSRPAGAGGGAIPAATDVSLEDAGLPTLRPKNEQRRIPTRVVVRELGIDLPVVVPPAVTSARFPWCDVAEYLPTMSRPGRAGTTFVYAHAREGMFLPILTASRIADGEAMLGMRIQVFTSDDRQFTYEVAEVLRHVVSLDPAYRATTEQLILQTSEGAHGTPGKTMLVARPVEEVEVSHVESHPTAHPVRCS